MPIYEYYCADNHTIYQFYAKTLAQGQTVPRCPDNPKFKLRKLVSAFAITGGTKEEPPAPAGPDAAGGEDPKLEAALGAMESEFASVDENDPKAMARMMRRMSELTGEKIDGEMEEVVRKLEEGADPEELENQMGGEAGSEGGGMDDDGFGPPGAAGDKPDPKEPRHKFKIRRTAPRRDPKLYDYE